MSVFYSLDEHASRKWVFIQISSFVRFFPSFFFFLVEFFFFFNDKQKLIFLLCFPFFFFFRPLIRRPSLTEQWAYFVAGQAIFMTRSLLCLDCPFFVIQLNYIDNFKNTSYFRNEYYFGIKTLILQVYHFIFC